MIFDWFNAKEAVSFAETIAAEIVTQIPLTAQPKNTRIKKKDRNPLDGFVIRINGFAKKTPMNVYKKAKFLNVIKWKLKESGYDEPFINEVVVLFTAALGV